MQTSPSARKTISPIVWVASPPTPFAAAVIGSGYLSQVISSLSGGSCRFVVSGNMNDAIRRPHLAMYVAAFLATVVPWNAKVRIGIHTSANWAPKSPNPPNDHTSLACHLLVSASLPKLKCLDSATHIFPVKCHQFLFFVFSDKIDSHLIHHRVRAKRTGELILTLPRFPSTFLSHTEEYVRHVNIMGQL